MFIRFVSADRFDDLKRFRKRFIVFSGAFLLFALSENPL